MEIQIKRATETDLATLLEFEAGIIYAERPFDPTLKEGEIHYYDLLALIQSPIAEVLVATNGDEIIGSGYALIKEGKDYQKHTHYAYLGFMYVKPAYRGQGVNGLVLDGLIAWAKVQGITEIRLEVYDDNIAAKKAYTKAGFKGNMLEMRLDVSDTFNSRKLI